MNTKSDSNTAPISRQGAKAPGAAASPTHATTDEQAPAKPPLFWMLVPLVLIGLAIFFAR